MTVRDIGVDKDHDVRYTICSKKISCILFSREKKMKLVYGVHARVLVGIPIW